MKWTKVVVTSRHPSVSLTNGSFPVKLPSPSSLFWNAAVNAVNIKYMILFFHVCKHYIRKVLKTGQEGVTDKMAVLNASFVMFSSKGRLKTFSKMLQIAAETLADSLTKFCGG